MDLNPEPLLNGPGQLPGGERGIGRQLPGDKLHHLGGQFVSTLRAALLRQQAEYTVVLKGRLSLIKRRAGEAEGLRGLADGTIVDVNLTQHLVLDLHEVVGIEKVAVAKQSMTDGFRMRIECSMTAKRLALLRLVGWRGQRQNLL